MAADDLIVVVRFVAEVLEQRNLAAMDDLVDLASDAINWREVKELLATLADEAPGLRYHVTSLEEGEDGVAARLQLSIPITFHVTNGRIDDIVLPDYLLPAPEEPVPAADKEPDQVPLPDVDPDLRLPALRRAIDEAAVELAANIERFGRTRRDLTEARERQAHWEQRAGREEASKHERKVAQARADAQKRLVEAYARQRNTIRKVIIRLANALHRSEERLVRLELRAEELAIQRRLADVTRSLSAVTDNTTDIAERIRQLEARLRKAEEAAATELTRARRDFARRLDALRNVHMHWRQDLEERLREIMAELEADKSP